MKKLTGLLVLLGICLQIVQPGLAADLAPTSEPDAIISGEQMPLSPAAINIAVGAHLRPTVNYDQELQDFNALVGKEAAVLMYFTSWQHVDPFLIKSINNAADPESKPVIMITWQPLYGRANSGCSQDFGGVVPYAHILAGGCDAYIQAYANMLKGFPQLRFIIRFAHEFNILDTPWYPPLQGATPADYAAAFRYVHDKFYATGITNVEWMWSPNNGSNPDTPANSMHNYWPGADYVDWIGLSGYNWYDASLGAQPWLSFEALYDAILTDLACRYARPQILAEIATVEGNGSTYSKSAWIQDAYAKIPNYPFVKAVVWFNDYAYADPSQADFRVTTSWAEDNGVFPLPAGSGAWTNAYRQAIAPYSSSLPTAASATPPYVYCGEPRITVGPQLLIGLPGDHFSVQVIGEYLSENVPLSLSAGGYLSGSYLSNSQLTPPSDREQLQVVIAADAPVGSYQLTLWVGGVPYVITVQVADQLYYAHLPIVRD